MRKAFVCLSIYFLLSVGFLTAQEGIVFFEGSWEEAIEKSKEEEKLIFVDAYAQWCGPCKMMAKQVFTNAEVGAFFNANFINMKLDMEASESTIFRRHFSVSAYPTLFWVNEENQSVHKSVGAKKVEELLNQATLAISKNDRSGKYEADYLAGNRDFDLVYSYVKALNKAEKPSLKIANEYLDSQPEISEEQKAKFVLEACSEADSKLCQSLIAYKANLIQEIGQEAWDEKISSIAWRTVEKAIEYEYIELIDEAVVLMKSHHSDPEAFPYEAKLLYHSIMMQAKDYKNIAGKYYKKFAKKSEPSLLALIDQIKSKFITEQELMKDCKKYAERLLKLEKTESNYIGLADIYVHMKQNDKAIETCIKGTKWLKKHEMDTKKIEAYTKFLRQS